MMPTDPLYASQWHFGLIGNIERIWDDFNGRGVHVGIYDDGIDFNHSDLNDNYHAALHVVNNLGAVVSPFPARFIPGGDDHGTAVAGIIASEAGNNLGGVGVSWGARITGVNIFGASVYGAVNGPVVDNFLNVARQAVNFDISQNSWGAPPYQYLESSLAGTGLAAQLATVFRDISRDGRDGLGTVITQAAGNDSLDANRDGLNASRFTITVAATERDGFAASYSNFGSSILVAAPAAAVTTDLSGSAGNNASSLSYPERGSWGIREPLPATPFMAGSGGGWIASSWVVMDRSEV